MNKKKIDLSNFDFNEFKLEALNQLKSRQSLTGKDGILPPLFKELLESALEGEMEAHLTQCQETGIVNCRNGKTTKTMKSISGVFDLETPRDREDYFETPHLYLKVNDYPVVYVVKKFSLTEIFSPEIGDTGWFDYSGQPEMTSPGTKRRLT